MKINDLSLKNIFLFSWLMWLFFFLFKPFDYNYENIKLSSFLIKGNSYVN